MDNVFVPTPTGGPLLWGHRQGDLEAQLAQALPSAVLDLLFVENIEKVPA